MSHDLERKIQDSIFSETHEEDMKMAQTLHSEAQTEAMSVVTDQSSGNNEEGLNKLQNPNTWSTQILQEIEEIHVEDDGKTFQFAREDTPRRVYIAIKVKRISDVDNIRETFRCRFHCYFNWCLTYNEYMDYLEHKNNHTLNRWKPRYTPRYEFVNVVETHEVEEVTYPTGPFRVISQKDFAPAGLVGFEAMKAKMIRLKVDFDITFCEELELHNFPFDCQDYSIVLRESSGFTKASFVPEMRTLKEIRNGYERQVPSHFARVDPAFSVLDEWEFHNTRVEFAYSSATKSRGQTAYHQVTIRFKMRRRYLVYFWNVALYMMVISFLSLTSFFIPRDNGRERLTLVITLLLTAVANQHVVFELLPNVPYLTILHKYNLTCFVFVALVTVQAAAAQVDIVSWVRENAVTLDRNSLIAFTALWFLYNFYFVLWCAWKRHWESQKLYLDSDEIESQIDSYDKHNFTMTWSPTTMEWKGHQERIATFIDSDPRYDDIPIFDSFGDFFGEFLWRIVMCRCCPRDECCGYFPAGTCQCQPNSCCGCCCRSETTKERALRIKQEKQHRRAQYSTTELVTN